MSREYHDLPPFPPFSVGHKFGGEGMGSWYPRGHGGGGSWYPHGPGEGRDIPMVLGGGRGIPVVLGFSQPPSSLLTMLISSSYCSYPLSLESLDVLCFGCIAVKWLFCTPKTRHDGNPTCDPNYSCSRCYLERDWKFKGRSL